MPRATTRQQEAKQQAPASKKVHAMPAPTKGSKMMMMPPPARFGSNGRSSQSVSFNNIIYLAGQHAEDLTKDIKDQTQQVCNIIDKLLAESQSDKSKIIRADIFIKDKSTYEDMNEVWTKWVGDAKLAPPCTIAVVPDFIMNDVLIEVVIIAVVSKPYGEEGGEGDVAMEEEAENEKDVEEEEEGDEQEEADE